MLLQLAVFQPQAPPFGVRPQLLPYTNFRLRRGSAPGEICPDELPSYADVPLYRTAIAREGGHDHKGRKIVSRAALNPCGAARSQQFGDCGQ